jgi:hypothetical protein
MKVNKQYMVGYNNGFWMEFKVSLSLVVMFLTFLTLFAN